MQAEDAKQIALDLFAKKYNCAEATLSALVQALDLDSNCDPRIATGFGAGLGRWGEVCGAVAGAVMAIGLVYGRTGVDDIDSRERVYPKVNQILQAFEQEFGSIRCLDLTGCDMRTPEGMARSKELDLHGSVCPKFVAFATEAAVRIINEKRETH
ncbi:C-GCAxxG-C-C family protein [bacterium]|nr:C-GCAxxG-C-C family protein [bacterium]